MARAQSIVIAIFAGLVSFGLLTGPLRVAVFGATPRSTEGPTSNVNVKADAASATLSAPLKTKQMLELFQGLSYLLHDDYSAAIPILGKYALMGDARAQNAIGAMYYAGMGFPVDRAEAIKWFRLAAAQGGESDKETLTSALNGTWRWDGASSEPIYSTRLPNVPTPDPSVSLPTQVPSYPAPSRETAAIGARASIAEAYGSAPASGRFMPPSLPTSVQPVIGEPTPIASDRTGSSSAGGIVNARDGQYDAPAGPSGYVNTTDGTYYARSGSNGIIDTRTGQYIPTN